MGTGFALLAEIKETEESVEQCSYDIGDEASQDGHPQSAGALTALR